MFNCCLIAITGLGQKMQEKHLKIKRIDFFVFEQIIDLIFVF